MAFKASCNRCCRSARMAAASGLVSSPGACWPATAWRRWGMSRSKAPLPARRCDLTQMAPMRGSTAARPSPGGARHRPAGSAWPRTRRPSSAHRETLPGARPTGRAALQPAIEAEPDHLLQTVTAGGKQLSGGRGVAGSKLWFKIAHLGHRRPRSKTLRRQFDRCMETVSCHLPPSTFSASSRNRASVAR